MCGGFCWFRVSMDASALTRDSENISVGATVGEGIWLLFPAGDGMAANRTGLSVIDLSMLSCSGLSEIDLSM